MSKYKLDMKEYKRLARQAAAEGCVLIKNDQNTLPLKKGERVAVFGRIASTYYKSGLGSGGMVNTDYVPGILDALREEKDIVIEEKVRAIYDAWIEEHPFDEGSGWGKVPWSQQEMPVSEKLLEAGKDCDVAIVIIGRTAGEDQDNKEEPGSYLLTDEESKLIREVRERFARTVVILNVGNIIDMSWVTRYNPSAVLYAWQGGQEGGNAVADVLMGRVSPCGRLTDTIAYEIGDYPSTKNFGSEEKNFYEEDIYVGYRYFETFAKDRVMYPFGFGLSYTRFCMQAKLVKQTGDGLEVEVSVKNIGEYSAKEVAQVYVSAPQGKLGKPEKVLVGFAKTKELSPQEEETLRIDIPAITYASFDDSGVTNARNAFVLEEGTYTVFAGENVRAAKQFATWVQEFCVLEALEEALAPIEPFKRIKPVLSAGKELTAQLEDVPVRTINPKDRIAQEALTEIAYTGDRGYKLKDVYDKRVSMDDFLAQLSDEDLICLHRGEGMCSPKVTPGTAAAFGGITESLQDFGIPALCATDGPSGIRMDCGTKAFSLPNGTLLGCTFDLPLVEALYSMTGKELRQNRIDTLLGPGINIHRSPLNGRNFEYISEDPLLTGKMGAAQLLGLGKYQSSGTIKHFSTNNQEMRRHFVDAVVSQRALREIYLKCFEIAVKEGKCQSVMTTYGPLNGLWTAGSYDLNTTVLRKEWGFTGIVMTDWWAASNEEGQPSDRRNHASMVKAQNDLMMVCPDALDMNQDNIMEELQKGNIHRAQLQRNARNILSFALQSIAMQYEMQLISKEELEERKAVTVEENFEPEAIVYHDVNPNTNELVLQGGDWKISKGTTLVHGIRVTKPGFYDISFTVSSYLDELAQLPLALYLDNTLKAMISFRGTNAKTVVETRDLGLLFPGQHYIRLVFGAVGINVIEMKLKLREEFKMPF